MLWIIIDAYVWIRFLRNTKNNRIINCIIYYNIDVIVNNYLLSEVFDALTQNNCMTEKNAAQTLFLITRLTHNIFVK